MGLTPKRARLELTLPWRNDPEGYLNPRGPGTEGIEPAHHRLFDAGMQLAPYIPEARHFAVIGRRGSGEEEDLGSVLQSTDLTFSIETGSAHRGGDSYRLRLTDSTGDVTEPALLRIESSARAFERRVVEDIPEAHVEEYFGDASEARRFELETRVVQRMDLSPRRPPLVRKGLQARFLARIDALEAAVRGGGAGTVSKPDDGSGYVFFHARDWAERYPYPPRCFKAYLAFRHEPEAIECWAENAGDVAQATASALYARGFELFHFKFWSRLELTNRVPYFVLYSPSNEVSGLRYMLDVCLAELGRPALACDLVSGVVMGSSVYDTWSPGPRRTCRCWAWNVAERLYAERRDLLRTGAERLPDDRTDEMLRTYGGATG